ncbi:hypothetical protein [Thermus altitudinis]|uniref:hypothetical protein n=1 Tax=Thermus altitudinis TaxID=2908145 RepID=UPI003C12BACA
MTDTGGRLLKAFVHPAHEYDKWGGQALLLGVDLSLWPRVRKLFVDWGYRGLREGGRCWRLGGRVGSSPGPSGGW